MTSTATKTGRESHSSLYVSSTGQLTINRDTGKFCDQLLTEWRTGRDTNFPIECEDCTLGQWMKQLQAPIRYHDEGASKFSKATSACGATGYEYVKPTTSYISTMDLYMETWLDSFTPPTPTP